MADTQVSPSGTEKKSNPLVWVGIGCLVLVVVTGVALSLVFKFFAKQIGTGAVQKIIESKTGVKTNLQDIEEGKLSFTDPKTGTKVDIGSTTIPSSFPKDFPIYPGMKLLSSLAGTGQAEQSGFWLTFTSNDTFEKVNAYYATELTKNGWKESSNYSSGSTSTKTVEKGNYSGSVSITQSDNSKETEILIMLGDKSNKAE